MSKYGYVGKESDIPQQAFKSNAGILSVNDHLALSQEDKLTQFGQLELLETQSSATAVSSVNFETISEDIYDTHLVVFSNNNNSGYQYLSVRFGNNGSYTSSGYMYANRFMQSSGGSWSEYKSTSDSEIRIGAYVYRGESAYIYVHDIGNAGTYTNTTSMMVGVEANNVGTRNMYGMGKYPSKSSFNNIQILRTAGTTMNDFRASIYGIRRYE